MVAGETVRETFVQNRGLNQVFVCEKCGVELYTEIDYAEFKVNKDIQVMERHRALTRYLGCYKSYSYYVYTNPVCARFSPPDKLTAVKGLQLLRELPPMEIGQKATVYYTTDDEDRKASVIAVQPIQPAGPLPFPPPGYTEIDLAAFIAGCKTKAYKPGSRFWSRVKYHDEKKCISPEEDYSISFNSVQTLPPLAKGTEIVIMYTVTSLGPAASPDYNKLDSAILYDLWLLPPPAEQPTEEVTLEEFVTAVKSMTGVDGMERKFKLTARCDNDNQNNPSFLQPGKAGYGERLSPLDITNSFPLKAGQVYIMCLTVFGTGGIPEVIIDTCEIKPDDPVPAGYTDIDLADLHFDMTAGNITPGSKLHSWARYFFTSGLEICFRSRENGSPDQLFTLTKRPPKLQSGTLVRILYTAGENKQLTIDEIIVV
jgi:hypothetical protein